MKKIFYIILVSTALFAACGEDNTDLQFSTEGIEIDVDAAGGSVTRTITSTERWIASTDNAWITVSPANGRGTAECKFIIDSALTVTPCHLGGKGDCCQPEGL